MAEFLTLRYSPLQQVERLPFALASRGKVRDIFDLVNGTLLVVSTDRISTFDVVHPTCIPGKGESLTKLTVFWCRDFIPRQLPEIPTHFVTASFNDFPPALQPYRPLLDGRSMIVRKLEIFRVECVVRGYLFGSGWTEYGEKGSVCGIPLPGGLRQAEVLPYPVFTPTTKAETGHDLPMTFAQVEAMVGSACAAKLRDNSIAVYVAAARYALRHGVIIADTKFEWGLDEQGNLVLADEVLTPDSSRFWPKDQYRVGGSPPSLDKQYVRDYVTKYGWNRQPPAPGLPDEVVAGTSQRYQEICRILLPAA